MTSLDQPYDQPPSPSSTSRSPLAQVPPSGVALLVVAASVAATLALLMRWLVA